MERLAHHSVVPIVGTILLGLAGSPSVVHACFACPPPGPPICAAAPKVESTVLGINGTANSGASGIMTVALVGGASNVTLSVAPFSPPAAFASFRAIQTSAASNAQGTVVVTDQSSNTCTVPVSFRVRSAGIPANEELCATSTGEGYSLKVIATPGSQPAGTSACSANLPLCATDTLPAGYEFSPTSRHLTIRSPITDLHTLIELTQTGAFDPHLRLMWLHSNDGGVTFSPPTDATASVASGSTILRGTVAFSDNKFVSAIGPDVIVPTLGTWGMVIMSLLLLTASSVLLVRRPVLAGGSLEDGRLPLFVPEVFGRILAGTAALGLLALAALVFLGRALGPTDIVGSLVSGGILVYLVHLWFVMARGSSPGEGEDR